jgi:hypothetical protein
VSLNKWILRLLLLIVLLQSALLWKLCKFHADLQGDICNPFEPTTVQGSPLL